MLRVPHGYSSIDSKFILEAPPQGHSILTPVYPSSGHENFSPPRNNYIYPTSKPYPHTSSFTGSDMSDSKYFLYRQSPSHRSFITEDQVSAVVRIFYLLLVNLCAPYRIKLIFVLLVMFWPSYMQHMCCCLLLFSPCYDLFSLPLLVVALDASSWRFGSDSNNASELLHRCVTSHAPSHI